MIFYMGCNACGRGLAIIGTTEAVVSLFSSDVDEGDYSCVINRCPGRLSCKTKAKHYEEISVEAFYRAINGWGYSISNAANPEDVLKHLKEKKIVDAVVEPTGDPVRTILKSLMFEDGSIIYLGASSKGACAYCIEEAP